MSTGRKQDLLCVDSDLRAIIELYHRLVLVYKACSAMDIFGAVILEVALVYIVQVLNDSISLLFEALPIERCLLLDRESYLWVLIQYLHFRCKARARVIV